MLAKHASVNCSRVWEYFRITRLTSILETRQEMFILTRVELLWIKNWKHQRVTQHGWNYWWIKFIISEKCEVTSQSSWISLTWNGDGFGPDSLQPFLMVCRSVWQRLKKMNRVHFQSNLITAWPFPHWSVLKPLSGSVPLACARGPNRWTLPQPR